MAPPAPANAAELREALRLRQERWFSECAAERERATATAELMSERPSHDDADLVAEASTSANPGPEAILDRITERLASQLRTELRTEVEAAAAAGQQHAKANSASMEAFLASEIESHTCPICYELMLAPERPPILLFPCGHFIAAFSLECLDREEELLDHYYGELIARLVEYGAASDVEAASALYPRAKLQRGFDVGVLVRDTRWTSPSRSY